MRFLWLSFLVLTPLLVLLAVFQESPTAFADGRLVCEPMPPRLERIGADVPLLKRRPVDLARLAQRNAAARPPGIQIVEPQPGNETLAMLRQLDQTDWGMARGSMTGELLASLPPARLVAPVPVRMTDDAPTTSPTVALDTPGTTGIPAIASTDAPGTSPTVVASLPPLTDEPRRPVQPNLYLPEGAMDEAGAFLTLIKPELTAHEQPDAKSAAAAFVLKEGDRVRPLTRLRNEKDFDWIRFERDGREWWAQAEYFIRVDPRNQVALGTSNLPVGGEVVDKDSALPPLYAPDDLVPVPRDLMLDPREITIRKETLDALTRMVEAADKDGHKLRVFSGFRDFDYQKKLYLEAIARHGPKQNGTAAPGYSEHQLGTTVDISNTDRRYMLSGRFASTPEGRWLTKNLERFGFRHTYTQENTEETGYKPEPWHIRYVGTSNLVPPPDRAVAGR